MPCRRGQSAGFSLLEMLIVVALMGILAALILPRSQPGIHDRLQATAQIMASDLAHGRSLAVTNNSSYRFTFKLLENRYVLEHSGTNSALDTLPVFTFHSPYDTSTQHAVDLDELPGLVQAARLYAVMVDDSSPRSVTELEFGPLGETTESEQTVIWLTAGSGSARRFLSLSVHPVTGLVSIGEFQASLPPVAAPIVQLFPGAYDPGDGRAYKM